MNLPIKLTFFSVALAFSMIYWSPWTNSTTPVKEKIYRPAVWERETYEIVGKNAYADESSCIYNAANCAIDQIRKNVY